MSNIRKQLRDLSAKVSRLSQEISKQSSAQKARHFYARRLAKRNKALSRIDLLEKEINELKDFDMPSFDAEGFDDFFYEQIRPTKQQLPEEVLGRVAASLELDFDLKPTLVVEKLEPLAAERIVSHHKKSGLAPTVSIVALRSRRGYNYPVRVDPSATEGIIIRKDLNRLQLADIHFGDVSSHPSDKTKFFRITLDLSDNPSLDLIPLISIPSPTEFDLVYTPTECDLCLVSPLAPARRKKKVDLKLFCRVKRLKNSKKNKGKSREVDPFQLNFEPESFHFENVLGPTTLTGVPGFLDRRPPPFIPIHTPPEIPEPIHVSFGLPDPNSPPLQPKRWFQLG